MRTILLVLMVAMMVSSTGALFAQDVDVDAQGRILEERDERDVRDEQELQDGGNAGVSEEGEVFVDELEALRRHPLDVRTATAEGLALLPVGLDEATARALIALSLAHPKWGLARLTSELGLSTEQRRLLRIYTYAAVDSELIDRSDNPPFSLRLRMRVGEDLHRRRGYTAPIRRIIPLLDTESRDSIGTDTLIVATPYLGSPLASRLQIACTWGRLAFGGAMRKEAGERLLVDDTLEYAYHDLNYADNRVAPEKFDNAIGGHLSWYASVDFDHVRLYGGDYTFRSGEGLFFSGSGGFFGSSVTDPSRQGRRSIRSSGMTTSGLFSGVAIEIPKGGIGIAGFSGTVVASRRKFDASTLLLIDGNDTVSRIRSLRDDGYRRTHSELRAAREATEELAGTYLEYSSGKMLVGITGYRANVALASGKSTEPYGGISVNCQLRTGATTIFSELGMTNTGSRGGRIGLATTFDGVGLRLGLRSAERTFIAPHGDGNEAGRTTLGLRLTTATFAGMRGTATLEATRLSEPTPTLPMPTWRSDARFELMARPIKTGRITLSVGSSNRGDARNVNDASGESRKRLVDRRRWTLRCDGETTVMNRRLRLRGRFDRTLADPGGAMAWVSGVATTIDIQWQATATLSLRMRHTEFDTDGSDASIYLYEPDIGGSGHVAALNGHGMRCGLLVTWQPSRWASLAARYSNVTYTDRRVISPGSYQEHSGRHDDNIAVEIDLRF